MPPRQYSEQQMVNQIKTEASYEAQKYIEELEARLQEIAARCQEYSNVEHLSDVLTDLYTQFRALPHNGYLCIELCPDGSGQIVNWKEGRAVCSWDNLESAKFALEQQFSIVATTK